MSVIQEAYDFDPAAFIAAAQALASQPLKAVSRPGLPPCFKRVLTAGDRFLLAALDEPGGLFFFPFVEAGAPTSSTDCDEEAATVVRVTRAG